jgi:hypothetical protein
VVVTSCKPGNPFPGGDVGEAVLGQAQAQVPGRRTTVDPASQTRRPAAFCNRVAIRAPAGTWPTCSVNESRGQARSVQYQRRLRHTSFSRRSP